MFQPSSTVTSTALPANFGTHIPPNTSTNSSIHVRWDALQANIGPPSLRSCSRYDTLFRIVSSAASKQPYGRVTSHYSLTNIRVTITQVPQLQGNRQGLFESMHARLAPTTEKHTTSATVPSRSPRAVISGIAT
jgi:hypothetical protein